MEDNTQQYGLTTTDNTPVPLKKLEVKTEIQGFISSTCYTLTYENEEEKPVEASFVFPMDDSSAIFHFEAEIDGRRIVAECQDKEQAKQTYNDAMEAGQSAFLLAESEESRDVFKCDVGNLPPKSTALVRLYYVTELDIQANGTLLYVFPVTLFERYELTRQQDPTQSKRVKLPRAKDGHIPYELDFNLKVLSPREILSVEFVDETDGKEAQVNNGKEDAHNYLTARIAGSFRWDHDISVKVLYSDPFEPHVVSEKGSPIGEGILKLDMVMLNFFPNLEGEETRFAKAELLFVMDRSGSMGGQSMIHAREALLECLKIIPEECIFNIISFGSTFKKLFETSQQADAKNIKRAQAEVRKMEANLGGTEILSPLVDIMASKDTISEYPRQVFLFTDGGVSNSDGVISFIKENADSTRVFTFGIGSGVSTSLVKGAAHAGKGKCVMVKDTKDLASQASQTLKCAMQPNVDDVAITFAPKVEATFFPSILPPIFNGEHLIAYAVLKNAKKDDLVASLKGRINGRLVHHSLDFTFKEAASDLAPVHRLAAKAAIKQMEEDEDWQNQKKNEIIIMSTAANVVSKYTAFVGVDHQGQKMQTPSVQRELPVAHAPMQAYGGGAANSEMAMGRLQYCMMAAPSALPPPSPQQKSFAMDCMMAAPSAPPPPSLQQKSFAMAREVQYEFQCESATTVRKVKKRSCDFEGDDSTLQTDTQINQKDIKAETKPLEKIEPKHKEEFEPNKASCHFISQLECNFLDQEIDMEDTPYHREYQPCKVTECVLFGRWKKGAWYPIQSITSSSYSKYKATYKDGCKVKIDESEILSAGLLSVGDIVGLCKDDTSDSDIYDTAIILEFNKQLDSFVLARYDGKIQWSQATNMMIPAKLAEELKTREEGSTGNINMCKLSEGNTDVILTTSDISELRENGWITNHTVNFYTSYLEKEVLSAEELKVTHIFPVEFSAHLFAEENENMRFGRLGKIHFLYDKVWPWLRQVSLKEKHVMYVPVFDEVHWYLIVIYLQERTKNSCGANSTRISFEIMDSYYHYSEQLQIQKLSAVLKMLAKEQNLKAEVASTAIQRNTPIQENESDCGICMLQCLLQCYKDNLDPKPTENWFDQGIELRREISGIAMKIFWEQNK